MGTRSWFFASTENDAQPVGTIQSVLVTGQLNEVDSYT